MIWLIIIIFLLLAVDANKIKKCRDDIDELKSQFNEFKGKPIHYSEDIDL